MRQAEQAFGTPIPASVSALWESAAASEKESALYLKDRTALGDFWINWRLIPDASGKAMYLKELFFPPEEYMRGRYTKHKHAPLPWLYLRRGWKGMLKWLSR
jgi:hypothetical protein